MPSKDLKERHDQQRYPGLCKDALETAKAAVRESITPDMLLIQVLHSIDDLHKAAALLLPRVREFAGYYYPELVEAQHDALSLCKTLQVALDRPETSMGSIRFDAKTFLSLKSLSASCAQLLETAQQLERRLEAQMRAQCPNLSAMCGELLGARLLAIAGSLKRLAAMPASTIQLLGAEKALFRHLIQHAKSPKHGVLFAHALVQRAPMKRKGKAARAVADKTAICARLDYFKGEMLGDKLREELEARL